MHRNKLMLLVATIVIFVIVAMFSPLIRSWNAPGSEFLRSPDYSRSAELALIKDIDRTEYHSRRNFSGFESFTIQHKIPYKDGVLFIYTASEKEGEQIGRIGAAFVASESQGWTVKTSTQTFARPGFPSYSYIVLPDDKMAIVGISGRDDASSIRIETKNQANIRIDTSDATFSKIISFSDRPHRIQLIDSKGEVLYSDVFRDH